MQNKCMSVFFLNISHVASRKTSVTRNPSADDSAEDRKFYDSQLMKTVFQELPKVKAVDDAILCHVYFRLAPAGLATDHWAT